MRYGLAGDAGDVGAAGRPNGVITGTDTPGLVVRGGGAAVEGRAGASAGARGAGRIPSGGAIGGTSSSGDPVVGSGAGAGVNA